MEWIERWLLRRALKAIDRKIFSLSDKRLDAYDRLVQRAIWVSTDPAEREMLSRYQVLIYGELRYRREAASRTEAAMQEVRVTPRRRANVRREPWL